MKKLFIGTTFILCCLTGLGQHIRTDKNIGQKLNNPNFTSVSLRHSYQTLDFQKPSNQPLDWKKGWDQHPTRKIVFGSIFIVLGGSGIAEALIPTNMDNPSDRISQIGTASLGGMLLTLGTVSLIRGINLNRQNKLKVTTTNNGIGLTYEI
jgi:hypothetical protein